MRRWPWSASRPAARGGRSKWPPSTRRPVISSAGRSAVSRPSSTCAPTCCWRPSQRCRRRASWPAHSPNRAPPASRILLWHRRTARMHSSSWRRPASRYTAVSVSPGSIRRTCICAEPAATPSCWAARLAPGTLYAADRSLTVMTTTRNCAMRSGNGWRPTGIPISIAPAGPTSWSTPAGRPPAGSRSSTAAAFRMPNPGSLQRNSLPSARTAADMTAATCSPARCTTREPTSRSNG